MFCKNCGAQMNPNQAICLGCGCATGVGTNYCMNCGSKLMPGAAVCTSCGVATGAGMNPGYGSNPGYGTYPGYGAAYPGQQAGIDPGEQDAKSCKLFGILGLLFGWIFGLIAILKYNDYKKNGNGMHESDARTGKNLAIAGIVINIVLVIGGGVAYAVIAMLSFM